MMAEALSGKTLDELEALAEHFRSMMQGRPPGEMAEESLGDLESLKVVRQYPVRIKCALLPWTALEEGIDGYRSNQARDQ
jgi:nitrogen fixation NifU-like protein